MNTPNSKAAKPFAFVGSVSFGTMRSRDLIPAFLCVLAALDDGEYNSLKTEYTQGLKRFEDTDDQHSDDSAYYESEDADRLLDGLFDVLGSLAPSYLYFGSHPGDGADYGFWLSDDWRTDAQDNGTPVVLDAGDLPSDFTCGEWFQVSDHGNVTLYLRDEANADTEVCSIV